MDRPALCIILTTTQHNLPLAVYPKQTLTMGSKWIRTNAEDHSTSTSNKRQIRCSGSTHFNFSAQLPHLWNEEEELNTSKIHPSQLQNLENSLGEAADRREGLGSVQPPSRFPCGNSVHFYLFLTTKHCPNCMLNHCLLGYCNMKQLYADCIFFFTRESKRVGK